MACVIFKVGEDGVVETAIVEPKSLQRHLDQGWTATDPNRALVVPQVVPPHLHIGQVDVTDGDAEAATLAAMGIRPGPQVGAMHVPV